MDLRVVEIDGSFGEGGGQIVRYALSLSALTLRPVKIINIRVKRDNPGLRPQHLTAVKALAEITRARVIGDRVGSLELYFEPRARVAGSFRFDVGTAGSVSLVIQAILPTLIFLDKEVSVEIIGGTDVAWSPPIDYVRFVFLHNLRLLGVEAEVILRRRGHYPRGGGIVLLKVKPIADFVKPVNIVDRGRVISVKGVSHAVKLPRHVAERQAFSAREAIKASLGIDPEIEIEAYPPERDQHLGPGSGIVLYADVEAGSRLGSDCLGEKGKRAEEVGREASQRLLEDLETSMGFDRYMSDMLIPYLFLARGRSTIGVARYTLHTYTAIVVAQKFFPETEVKVEAELDKPGRIYINGLGLSF